VSVNRIRTVLEMIKFEHSIFTLPFALTAALLAARYPHAPGAVAGWPTAHQFFWIVVAMVGARSAAMTMNRIADLKYDRDNPRTRQRALVTGELSVGFAWGFTLVAAAVLVVAAWQLNRLALELSPVALALVFFYSYTKRFTTWSHLVLGLCMGISPAAAWIAVAGSFDPRILLLCGAVTLWGGGFDVLYACQDVDFDRQAGLFSIPKRFGIARALVIARGMHVLMTLLLICLAALFHLAWPAWVGIAVISALLTYEHSLVRANNLTRVNAAFFTVNGYISILFFLFWGAAVWVARR
jgi:4-hydroxybenzoate polyprenyltransferase